MGQIRYTEFRILPARRPSPSAPSKSPGAASNSIWQVGEPCRPIFSSIRVTLTKDAIRRVGTMTYDEAEDYLVRAQEAANSYDNTGRKEGIRQFIDEKSYKPGLGAYDKSRQG